MNKFTPSIRKAPSAPIPQSSSSNNELVGMSPTEVVAACQWKQTSGRGNERHATGDTFLNLLTPKLFRLNKEGTDMDAIPQIYANFDNQEGSVAVKLAQHLSSELLNNGSITELQYFFKLVDSHTKTTIATDKPEYEQRAEAAADLPDDLKADVVIATDIYVPDPSVCAFLHFWVEQKGKPVRIASRNIEARFAPQVAVVARLAEAGTHMQAGVVPQAKVMAWLEDREQLAEKVEDSLNMDSFSVAEAQAEG